MHFCTSYSGTGHYLFREGEGEKEGGGVKAISDWPRGGGGNVCINKFMGVSKRPLVTAVLLRAKTYHKAGYRSYTLWPSDPDAKYQRSSGMRKK